MIYESYIVLSTIYDSYIIVPNEINRISTIVLDNIDLVNLNFLKTKIKKFNSNFSYIEPRAAIVTAW